MSNESKVIYRLRALEPHEEWACSGGCEGIKPKLHRNVYSQGWAPDGTLLYQYAEHYYTCEKGHLLEIWDKDASDYVVLPETHYTEHDNEYDLALEDVQNINNEFKKQREKFYKFDNGSVAAYLDIGDIRITEFYITELLAMLSEKYQPNWIKKKVN